MKPSVDKLRWILAGGSLLLLFLLVAVVSYGRYKAAQLWKDRLHKLGVHLEQTTDDATYSQTINGRTVFTLRAGKAVQRKDGKTLLHNVHLTLYGKNDGSEDQISGSEFEYDEKSGVARALGQVEMEIRVPRSLVKKSGPLSNADADATSRDIHVQTSGLTYARKLGTAVTDQQVILSYQGLQCTATGAEFDSGQSIVRLLANVEIHGELKGQPVQLHAAKAELNHASDVVSLARPELKSGNDEGSAAAATLQLRHDGSLETAEAEGHVALQQMTRRITASRLDGRFTENNLPMDASLTGGVVMTDTNPAHAMHGSASRADAVFDGKGQLTKWFANGKAQLLAAVPQKTGRPLQRALYGERIEGTLQPQTKRSGSQLSNLHVTGTAHASAESASAQGIELTQLAADDLQASFGEGASGEHAAVRSVTGKGNARLQQSGPGDEQRVSTSDALQIKFAPNEKGDSQVQISTAEQDGHVAIESRSAKKPGQSKTPEPIFAKAEHSRYDGGTEELSLTDNAQFSQGNTTITAKSLILNQRTGNSDAAGDVLTTLTPQQPQSGTQATHIRSSRAHLVRETQVGTFQGTDGSPAKLWQGGSQVEAATITLDGKKHTVAARPEVPGAVIHSIFAPAQNAKPGTHSPEQTSQVERVTANALDYDDVSRLATFTGNFRAQGQTGQLQAQRAQLFFAPASKSSETTVPSMEGSLQRAIVSGDVRLAQPGKTGRGDKLVYTAADSTFVLTGSPGHPPQIVDATRGNITGASLLFRSSDNEVIVSSSSKDMPADDHVRVHTETGVKQ